MHDSSYIGTERVGRLLIKFTMPAVVASLTMALYNIVDRLYIGRFLSTDAMAGLTLTFPYMMILASFGTLVGVGSGALLSLRLGEGDKPAAERILGQCIAIKLLFFIVIPVFAFLTLDETLLLFGGTEASIPYAREYLKIILYGNLLSHLSFGLSNLMRAEGNAQRAMNCMFIGAISNIVLDPIFIFWLDLGIKGAAWATNIAMFFSTIYAVSHYMGNRCVVKLHIRYIRIWPKLAFSVFAIGLSPFVIQSVASAINISFNHSFKTWAADTVSATAAIAAIGNINGILLFMLMPIFGLGQGMQPIVGYNYGAKKYERVISVYKLSMKVATIICFISTLLCIVFADKLGWLFSSDTEQQHLIAWGLRVMCSGFLVIGAPIITTTYFQSVGRAHMAIYLSLLRQAIILIPLIFILPTFFGMKAIWFSGPASDFLSASITMTIVVFELKRLRKMKDSMLYRAEDGL